MRLQKAYSISHDQKRVLQVSSFHENMHEIDGKFANSRTARQITIQFLSGGISKHMGKQSFNVSIFAKFYLRQKYLQLENSLQTYKKVEAIEHGDTKIVN